MVKVFLIIMSIGLLSCSSKISKEDLIGTYSWNNSQNGKLEILDNGTYKYQVNIGNRQINKNEGTWTLGSNNREIRFSDFSFITDGLGKGIWISRIKKKENEVHLIYASEENIYLKKIDCR